MAQNIENSFDSIHEKIISQSSIIMCTLSSCASSRMKRQRFDVGLVDEGGHCMEVY